MNRLFILPLLLLLTACEPTKITQTWTAPNAKPQAFKKILVLGVLTEADSLLRVKMENHLAEDLRAIGYQAIPANTVFPAGTFVKGDTARAMAALQGSGFDGILTVVLLDKKKEKYYVPGKITDYNMPGQYSAFNRYYSRVSERIYSPGYFGEETKYVWDNNFYDLTQRDIIYSARTRTFDIASVSTLAHQYGQLMVQSLVDKKVILPPQPAD